MEDKQNETLNSSLNNETTNESSTGTVSSSTESTTSYNFEGANMNSKKGEKSGSYHATLLLNFFLGSLGIHRFINGKVKSGIVMLVLSILSSTPFAIFVALSYDKLADGDGSAWLIAFILLGLVFIVPIWRFIDLIVIMSGKFKNTKTGENVTSGKSFFKTWSNILVLVFIVLSIISSTLAGIFVDFPTFDDETVEKDGNDDEKDKKNSSSSNEYVESLTDCYYSDDVFNVEDFDEFQDTLEDYYGQYDYESDLYEYDDEEAGVLYFAKEEAELEYVVSIRYEEKTNGEYTIKSCNFEVTYYDYDANIYLAVGYDTYDENIRVFGSFDYDEDEEVTVTGRYTQEDDEYDLNAFLDSEEDDYYDYDSDTDFSYDADKDEYEVMDYIYETMSAYLDEVEIIFE